MSSGMTIPGFNSLTQTYFTQLIDALMATERQPIQRLQTQKTSLNTLLAAYTSLDTRLKAFHTAVQDLITSPSSVWGAKVAAIDAKSDPQSTILSATASRSAAPGSYRVEVTSLAQAHRVVSDRLSSTTAALGLQGEFTIGGEVARDAVAEATSSAVSSFGTAEVHDGLVELGRGTYHVEVRDHDGVLQFRVVDASGQAVSIADSADQSGARTTSGWQDLSSVAGSTYDTGRGLTITFEPLLDHSVSNAVTVPGTVDAFATSGVMAGQQELDDDTYYVEVRESGDRWEFRLVDSAGEAVSVYDAGANDGAFTSDWQGIEDALTVFQDGVFVTGRGLSIELGAGPYTEGVKDGGAASVAYTSRSVQPGVISAGAAAVGYQAQGALVTVRAADSLEAIAKAVNAATYAQGDGVVATVVDERLVLTAQSTGTEHNIIVSNSDILQSLGLIDLDGSFKNTAPEGEPGYVGYRAAADAQFTVNGIAVSRSSNTGIADVISGVTLDLAHDAAGQSATVTISHDTTAIRKKIDTFISTFNDLQTDIKSRTGVVVTGSGQDATYTRSALSGETILSRLRTELFGLFGHCDEDVPPGSPRSLRELGITLDGSLRAAVSNPDALGAALTGDLEAANALFESLMQRFRDALAPFVESQGIVDGRINQTNARIEALDRRVSSLEKRLEQRRLFYVRQYGYLQVQLARMQQTGQSVLRFWGLGGNGG